MALYLAEGASLPETGTLAQQLQEVVHRAYHAAVSEAATDVTGIPPAAPPWGEGISEDNPFNPTGD